MVQEELRWFLIEWLQIPAEDFSRGVGRGPLLGAQEQHVLQEVCQPLRGCGFKGRGSGCRGYRRLCRINGACSWQKARNTFHAVFRNVSSFFSVVLTCWSASSSTRQQVTSPTTGDETTGYETRQQVTRSVVLACWSSSSSTLPANTSRFVYTRLPGTWKWYG